MNRHLSVVDRVRLTTRPARLTVALVAATAVGTSVLTIPLLRQDPADASSPSAGQSNASANNKAPAAKKVRWHASANLLRNSRFANETAHWRSGPGTRAKVLTNKSGQHIARVTVAPGTHDARLVYADAGETQRGEHYRATIQVRGRASQTPASLRLREQDGKQVIDVARKAIQTGRAYQQISVDYVAKQTGSTLKLRVKSIGLGQQGAVFIRSASLVTLTRVDASGGSSRVSNSTPDGWQLAWSDEFNGSSVDSRKWRVRDGDYMSYDLATIRKSNVSVSDGILSMRARRQSDKGRDYTSAYLDTIGKASWTYGRFEMRARLPLAQGSSQGLWPAFWLRPDDGGVGELDIMEAVGSDTSDNKVSDTIWYDYNGTYPKQVGVHNVSSSTTKWHTYAVEWDPDAIRWYVDDVLTYERTLATTPWLSKAFSRPFNIRLNLQVGGSWAKSPNAATDFSQTYDVDYVRVYQRA